MKLLVLAQVPPPLHGQSIMVRTMVEGLPAYGVDLGHINLRLSRTIADIGGWRPGKLLALLDACWHTVAARFLHGCDTLYYVPAPGKRGALYRDWLVMLLCRPFYPRLVLHWHATGLGAWLRTSATGPERWLTRRLLGRVDLSIVLAESLLADAEVLTPKRSAVVPNGIAAAAEGRRATRSVDAPTLVLFLGLCAESKGLFDLVAAVLAANLSAGFQAFELVAAGSWPDEDSARRFTALGALNPGTLRHVGFVRGEEKTRLLRHAGCLALPTRYPHEGQPLVLLEALAHDLPVVATRWRGIPETLPPACCQLVPPGDIAALTAALQAIRRQPPPAGLALDHFLNHFTAERHLTALATALRGL